MARLQRCVRLGKGNRALGVTAKFTCLSPHSLETLRPEGLIACGSFACAYKRADGKVVKFTQDESDVSALQQLQGDPRVVRLHEAYRLRGTRHFAVVVDRLRKAPSWMRDLVNQLWKKGSESVDSGAPTAQQHEAVRGNSPMERFSGPSGHTDPARLAEDTCGFLGKNDRRCKKLVTEIGEFYARNARKGIFVRDIHGGNIAVDETGRWRLIDVGFQSTTEKANARELAAVLRRKRSYRRRQRSESGSWS